MIASTACPLAKNTQNTNARYFVCIGIYHVTFLTLLKLYRHDGKEENQLDATITVY
jgi:hypothetical protein